MKKILRTALTLGLVWMGSCTDYGDDFDNLNQRIDALENQIAGFADLNSGVTALDGKVNALAEVLATLPDNTEFGTGLANLQEQLDALEAAMAALDANDTDIQDQVDALNDALALLNDDMQELLNANNVYPGDLIIRTEGALDAALEFVKDRETLIVNGALIIEPDGGASYTEFEGTSFSATEVNQLTSKITAVLGRTFEITYGEGDDLDDDGSFASGVVGNVTLGGEIQDIDGNLDLSNLVTLNGLFHVDDIEGDVDMSSLVRHTSLELNYLLEQRDCCGQDEYIDEDAVINYDSYPTYLEDIYGEALAYSGALQFDDIYGDIDLSSLISAYSLAFDDVEGEKGIDLSALVTVDKDLGTSDIDGGMVAPNLVEVGGNFVLDHYGNYDYPALVSVGDMYEDDYDDSDLPSNMSGDLIMDDNDTEIVNFPKLRYVAGEISVGSIDEYNHYNSNIDDDSIDNTFYSATSVTIYYEFSDDLPSFQVPGECVLEPRTSVRGFAAPNATSVTVNGRFDEWQEENVFWGDMYVDAPLASVTLNVAYADGDLGVNFASLTASTLYDVNGDLILVGNQIEAPVSVTLASLTGAYDIYTNGLDELELTLFDTQENEAYIYGVVNKLELSNLTDDALKLLHLEELTVTALNNYFDFSDIAVTCGELRVQDPIAPGDHEISTPLVVTLTTVNFTGANCNASVELGSNDATTGYATAFSSLTSVTLGGTFNTVEVVGAAGLTSINTSGTITSWDFVDNDAVTTYNVAHTPGTCGD
ncbi:MAG: hypothetical protein Salg2KO_12400 [Salibacteraceae bacterium]